MLFSELLVILLFVVLIAYWLNAMRAKELARQAGRHACEREQLAFLDDSVVLQKVAVRRDQAGHLALMRSYDFEFTSDGACRYRGNIDMLGKAVHSLYLEVHRLPPEQ